MDERTGEMRDTLTSKGTSSSLDFYSMLRSLFRINKECLILEPLPSLPLLCTLAVNISSKIRDCHCTKPLHYDLLSSPGASTYQVYFVIPRVVCPSSEMGILC